MPVPRWPLHKLTPNAGSVALLVARLPLPLPVRLPLLLPVEPTTPLAPVRRLMPSLDVKHTHKSRMNGMPPPARTDAATCVSRTPTRCVVTVTKRRAHPRRDERPSPLNLSPARCGAFSLRKRCWKHYRNHRNLLGQAVRFQKIAPGIASRDALPHLPGRRRGTLEGGSMRLKFI
jgi:hypothetical protein